jgi:hypothetical protein
MREDEQTRVWTTTRRETLAPRSGAAIATTGRLQLLPWGADCASAGNSGKRARTAKKRTEWVRAAVVGKRTGSSAAARRDIEGFVVVDRPTGERERPLERGIAA